MKHSLFTVILLFAAILPALISDWGGYFCNALTAGPAGNNLQTVCILTLTEAVDYKAEGGFSVSFREAAVQLEPAVSGHPLMKTTELFIY